MEPWDLTQQYRLILFQLLHAFSGRQSANIFAADDSHFPHIVCDAGLVFPQARFCHSRWDVSPLRLV